MKNKELTGLLESRDAKTGENDAIFAALDERVTAWEAEPEETRGDKPDLSDEEVEAVEERTKDIDALDKRIKEETRAAKKAELIREARAQIAPVVSDETDVSVTKEPMIYGPDNPDNSYYADIMRTAHGVIMPGYTQASERLSVWAHQVEREVAEGTDEGKRATDMLRTHFRGNDADSAEVTRRAIKEIESRGRTAIDQKNGVEERSIVTGGGATASAASGGAAFVSPAIFLDPYAPWREAGRSFGDSCHKETLPDWGMNLYIPAVTGPAGIGTQSPEGTAILEVDPTFGYLNAPVITLAGEVTVSQQQLDRAGPGFAFDRLVFDQLNRDYNPKFDTYVLNQALAGATFQQWNGNAGSFALYNASGAGGFYGQVSKAKASIRTTPGTFLNPTHLFVRPPRWELIAAWTDANGRPLAAADYAGPYNALAAGSPDGDEGIEGDTRWRVNGLPVFTDNNIPSLGTTGEDQAIVGDLSEVFVYEGTPVTRVVPQTLAGSLLVLLQQFSYLAVLVRYPAGIVAISGTAMSAPIYTN